jgi:hypothetical protein
MSNDAIALYEPINLLKQVDEDIWIVDGSIVQMAMYGAKGALPDPNDDCATEQW